MANDNSARGYLILLALVSMLIVFQALAIGRDDDSFERPMLSVSTNFRTPEGPQETAEVEAPLELAPANFEPGALSTLPGEEDDQSDLSEESVIQEATQSPDVIQEATDEATIDSIISSQTSLTTEPIQEVAMTPVEEAPAQVEAETPQSNAVSMTHTVKRGESLWKLARRYGVTIDQLMNWNNIPSRRNIKPGQELKVNVSEEKKAQLAKVVEKKPVRRAATYTVQTGDNLYIIAKKFRTSVASLLLNNNVTDPEQLRPGQVLNISTANRIVHIVNQGETLWELSKLYSISLKELITHNDIKYRTIFPGQRLAIPVRDPKTLQTLFKKKKASKYGSPLRGRLCGIFGWRIHPILKRRLFHCGVDLAARQGTKIGAIASGKVTFAGWLRGYGKVVVVKHGRKMSSRYAHCKSINVKVGQQVKAGQTIARVGTTGLSTGPHLHLEVRKYGRPVDPRDYVAI